MPPRQSKRWSDVEVPDAAAAADDRLLRSLFALDFDTSEERQVAPRPDPAPDALDVFKVFSTNGGVRTVEAAAGTCLVACPCTRSQKKADRLDPRVAVRIPMCRWLFSSFDGLWHCPVKAKAHQGQGHWFKSSHRYCP